MTAIVVKMNAERRKVCVSAPGVPHGVGHNSVCFCMCRWCRAERAALGISHKTDALIWECPSCAWTNFESDECDRCHTPRGGSVPAPPSVAPIQGDLFAEAA